MKRNTLSFKTASILSASLLATVSAPAATLLTGGAYDAPAFEYETGTGFEGEIHDEATDSGLEPADHIFAISMTSTTNFQGSDYFWIPSDETDAANNGVPYVGVGLEELTASDWTGSAITITLSALNYTGAGTGDFVFWTSSPTEVLHFDSSDGLNDNLNSLAGSHVHYNWGFSDVGTYEITFGISGDHVSDGAQTGSQTYTFQVVPEPSSLLLSAMGMLALFGRKRR